MGGKPWRSWGVNVYEILNRDMEMEVGKTETKTVSDIRQNTIICENHSLTMILKTLFEKGGNIFINHSITDMDKNKYFYD